MQRNLYRAHAPGSMAAPSLPSCTACCAFAFRLCDSRREGLQVHVHYLTRSPQALEAGHVFQRELLGKSARLFRSGPVACPMEIYGSNLFS
jgi:hypothetical protein